MPRAARSASQPTQPHPTAPADDRELIPLTEFFRKFGVSKSTFWRLAARGEAPNVVRLGRAILVPISEARGWMAARMQPASALCQAGRAAA